MVSPITSEEIFKTTHTFPRGKAPGPDGMPVELYIKYGDILAPKLAQIFTSGLSKGTLPDSMRQAHIALIHKEIKNPKLCASYRPIALLNIDIKILTLRIHYLLKTIIDSDQTGFMPQKMIDNNLRRLHTNIHAHHVNEGSRTVASLDIEKAFDTIERPFLWEILRRMGFH